MCKSACRTLTVYVVHYEIHEAGKGISNYKKVSNLPTSVVIAELCWKEQCHVWWLRDAFCLFEGSFPKIFWDSGNDVSKIAWKTRNEKRKGLEVLLKSLDVSEPSVLMNKKSEKHCIHLCLWFSLCLWYGVSNLCWTVFTVVLFVWESESCVRIYSIQVSSPFDTALSSSAVITWRLVINRSLQRVSLLYLSLSLSLSFSLLPLDLQNIR
jgi:hypothetical protein